jgi:arsenate reductase
MFELPAIDVSTKTRSSGALWLSEVVATAGLLLVIHGCVRTGRANVVAVAVGCGSAAPLFTSSTSFANPAVTIARTLSDSFAGIKPSSAPMFIVMQLIGAAIALVLIRFLYPERSPMPDHIPEVLFVCVHNAGSSQMAAALLDHHAKGRVIVRSAGTAPADTINPAVVEAMQEVGIDLIAAGARPKSLTEAAVRASDVVITMGCGDTCLLPRHPLPRLAARRPGGQSARRDRPIATRSTAASSNSSTISPPRRAPA